MPCVGHLHRTTNGQTKGEHRTVQACEIGFRDEERYGAWTCECVKGHGHQNRDGWYEITRSSKEQALVVGQRKTSTVSWMHVSKSSHSSPSTFSALALE